MTFTPETKNALATSSIYLLPLKHEEKKLIIVYIPIVRSPTKTVDLSQGANVLQNFQALIEQNYHDNRLKINDLAQKMHLSDIQLYRKIKALTTQGPSAYLRLYRLGKALELLKNAPDRSISQIAYSTGFSDPNYFSRVFASVFGRTPSEKRKELLNL